MKIDIKRRKRALKIISDLMEDARNVLIIHYSCECFYDRQDGTSPKITSIAVRKLDDGQTRCFSIHKEAELQHKSLDNLEEMYTDLEKQMLDKFYIFINENKDKKFVHWNMRDENYGFGAIELRFQILGGTPIVIHDDKKVDLARLLVDIYGVGYIGHPRLQNLIKLNSITDIDFLSGEEEARAFDAKQYISLHRSTSRKVDVFANILQRIQNKELKTKASYFEQYGGSLQWLFNFLYTNVYIGGMITIITIISALYGLFKFLNKQ